MNSNQYLRLAELVHCHQADMIKLSVAKQRLEQVSSVPFNIDSNTSALLELFSGTPRLQEYKEYVKNTVGCIIADIEAKWNGFRVEDLCELLDPDNPNYQPAVYG